MKTFATKGETAVALATETRICYNDDASGVNETLGTQPFVIQSTTITAARRNQLWTMNEIPQ